MGNEKTKLNMFATNKVFIFLDVMGLTTIVVNAIFINNNTLLTFGITFLTLGLTIPISLYFQTKQNEDSFEIINACHNYEIENLYEGRRYNASYRRMWNRIDSSFVSTKNLWLLGVAFPELLNPGAASDSAAKRVLKDPGVDLKIIVLNPDSPAAARRSDIEDPDHICKEGGTTVRNIRMTIANHTKILFRARLENKYEGNWKTKIADMQKSKSHQELCKQIIDDVKMRIKMTTFDPICFVIATDHTLFSEQYSFGRPASRGSTATCIGGYLPLIQYKKSSSGYEILRSHFDYIWNSKECTTDITEEHLEAIVPKQAIIA